MDPLMEAVRRELEKDDRLTTGQWLMLVRPLIACALIAVVLILVL